MHIPTVSNTHTHARPAELASEQLVLWVLSGSIHLSFPQEYQALILCDLQHYTKKLKEGNK